MDDRQKCFEAAKATLTGARAENQDRCLFLGNQGTILIGLADGLGGHPRGEVAAQLLMDVTESLFRQTPKPLYDPENFMLQCIGKAHRAILEFGRRQTPPIAPRTTAVLAVIQDGIAYWTHVGDSRLYLIRDRKVHAQTRDHTQVRYVRESATQVSRPRASLTRCLGGLPQPPTTTCGPPTHLQHGDAIVLCSDGLWGQVPRQALLNAFDDRNAEVAERLNSLVELAATAANSDNVTAVALRWLADGDASADAANLTQLTELVKDPLLDKAIEHLENVLEKAGKPK
jgi:serine/threonine protein phosphatase PrpC